VVEVPEVTLEAVLEDGGAAGRAPNFVRPCVTLEVGAEEGIESGDVVHVLVGEAEMVDGLDLAEGDAAEAVATAVKEDALDSLAAVNLDEEGVVVPGGSRGCGG